MAGALRGGNSLWDNDMVSGVAFCPRQCKRASGSNSVCKWTDGELSVDAGAVRLAYRLYVRSEPIHNESISPSVLVYFHANAELCTDLLSEIDRFLGLGYVAVLCPEFRGYAWSTGKPRLRSLGPDAEAFMKALPELLVKAGVCQESQELPFVVVHGRSLGSICAIHVASLPECNVAGLVVESGLVSLLDLPMVMQIGAMMPQMLQMLRAEPDPTEAREKLSRVTAPCLIIHGDQDEIVPVQQAVAAHRACGSTAKKLLRLSGCHHNDVRANFGPEYFRNVQALRGVAANDLPPEALDPLPRSGFGAYFSSFRCFPKRCLSPADDV